MPHFSFTITQSLLLPLLGRPRSLVLNDAIDLFNEYSCSEVTKVTEIENEAYECVRTEQMQCRTHFSAPDKERNHQHVNALNRPLWCKILLKGNRGKDVSWLYCGRRIAAGCRGVNN